jgi:hypothetical protein
MPRPGEFQGEGSPQIVRGPMRDADALLCAPDGRRDSVTVSLVSLCRGGAGETNTRVHDPPAAPSLTPPPQRTDERNRFSHIQPVRSRRAAIWYSDLAFRTTGVPSRKHHGGHRPGT